MSQWQCWLPSDGQHFGRGGGELLCSPHLAIHMGRYVCGKLGRKPTSLNIAEVCRAAMNARKRGRLRRGK